MWVLHTAPVLLSAEFCGREVAAGTHETPLWTIEGTEAWGTVERLFRNHRFLTTRIQAPVGTAGSFRPQANDLAVQLVSTMVSRNRSLWPPSQCHCPH